MNEYKDYFKAATQKMRPYIVGEDLTGVSVSKEDTPEKGGMIAKDFENGAKWYVSKKFYEKNYREKVKVVVMCGSSRFVDVMSVCAWLIEKHENANSMGLHLLPEWYCRGKIPSHLAEHEGVADQMDELHLRKIDLCDEIFVVNYDNYIGDSTKKEIAYAKKNKKVIRRYTSDVIGLMVDDIMATIKHDI